MIGRNNLERENKDRLVKKGAISCGHCPYHRRENDTRARKRTDAYKNINRESIRRICNQSKIQE